MKISLVVVNGKPLSGGEAKPTQEIPVKTNKYVIGRDPRCHLRPNNCHISNFHCALVVGNRSLVLKDLGSEHGTFVNGERITKAALKDGDQIRIAKLVFGVKVTADPLMPRKPKKKGSAEPLPASPPPSPSKSSITTQATPAPAAAPKAAAPAPKAPAPKPAPPPAPVAEEEDDIFGGGNPAQDANAGGFSGIMANMLLDEDDADDLWDDEPKAEAKAPAKKAEPEPAAADDDFDAFEEDEVAEPQEAHEAKSEEEAADFDFDSLELDMFETTKKEDEAPAKPAPKAAEAGSKEAAKPKKADEDEEDIFAAPSDKGGSSTGFSMVMADFLLEEEDKDDDDDF